MDFALPDLVTPDERIAAAALLLVRAAIGERATRGGYLLAADGPALDAAAAVAALAAVPKPLIAVPERAADWRVRLNAHFSPSIAQLGEAAAEAFAARARAEPGRAPTVAVGGRERYVTLTVAEYERFLREYPGWLFLPGSRIFGPAGVALPDASGWVLAARP
jgi:hypothetical protein